MTQGRVGHTLSHPIKISVSKSRESFLIVVYISSPSRKGSAGINCGKLKA